MIMGRKLMPVDNSNIHITLPFCIRTTVKGIGGTPTSLLMTEIKDDDGRRTCDPARSIIPVG
jgi:hypothetical protein